MRAWTDDPIDEYGALFDARRRTVRADATDTRTVGSERAARWRAERALRPRARRHDPGPASFVARLTVELLRPVPLVPLQAVARTFRPGQERAMDRSRAARRRRRGRAGHRAATPCATDVDTAETISPAVAPPPPDDRGRTAAVPVLRPRSHRLLDRERDPARRAAGSASRARRPRGSGCKCPVVRRRAAHAVRTRRRGRRLRQRCRQPAHVHAPRPRSIPR